MAEEKKVKVQFVRNVAYEGKDYGPDYEQDTADVEAGWARRFISNGKAVEVKEKKAASK